MTLAPDEFNRRFLLHVLPKGFHRIRHYGLLASATCKAKIARAKELIAAPLPSIDPSTEHDDAAMDHRPPCPCCGGRMIIVERLRARRRTSRSAVAPGHSQDRNTMTPRHRLTAPPAYCAASLLALPRCRPGLSPKPPATSSITPKSRSRPQPRRQTRYRDRRSAVDSTSQRTSDPSRRPLKSP
jgi:hypothetical protein